MAVFDWSTNPDANAIKPGINLQEGMLPGLLNDSTRRIMADIAVRDMEIRRQLERAILARDDQAPVGPRYVPAPDTVVGFDGNTEVTLYDKEDFRGPRGPQGPLGPPGPLGPTGPKGDPGVYAELNIIGAGPVLPVSAADGEGWIVPTGDDTGDLYIWYDTSWVYIAEIGTGESRPVNKVVFVTEDGNDANLGSNLATSVRTIERGLQLATAGTALVVYPGTYFTDGHLDVPDDVSVKGYGAARRTIIRPNGGFETRNVFRLGSGSYVEGFSFEGWEIDDLVNPTSGFAISFRPGAFIRRVPYVHNITVYRGSPPDIIAPPLNRDNGNPLVGNGAGVILADAAIVSQYSPFPNIMAWGATPSSPNGIGYCAKNGGVINAINAISLWGHKHYMAIDGGIIILNGCSSQFGDYSLWAEGFTQVLRPRTIVPTLVIASGEADIIAANEETIIDDMWNALVLEGLVAGWTAQQEAFTRADAARFLLAVRLCLLSGQDQPVRDFTRGLYSYQGEPVFAPELLPAFVRSFELLSGGMLAVMTDAGAEAVAADACQLVIDALENPTLARQPSLIAALGHQWTQPLAGVNKSGLPEAQRRGGRVSTIERSIIQKGGGVVRASGQDDTGNAIFVGGMKLDARTGRLSGRPFESAVSSIARRAALARSF